MSYQIYYIDENRKRKCNRYQKVRIPLLTGTFFLVFLLSVKIFWEEGFSVIQGILWSKDVVLIDDAIRYTYAAVKAGQPLPDAFQTFCRDLLFNAQLLG